MPNVTRRLRRILLSFSVVWASTALAAESAREEKPATSGEFVLFAPTTKWLPEPAIDIPDADAEREEDMRPYTERIPDSAASFDMVPIRGGTFQMGSFDDENGRRADEGPRHEVRIEPFWIGKYEVTWDEFGVCAFHPCYGMDKKAANEWLALKSTREHTFRDELVDAVTEVSWPVLNDPARGMGYKKGTPAIGMKQLGAKIYCRWLSAKTGRYYRLPTEAEWEYACRAGTNSAYSFGEDPEQLDQYAWYYDNSDERYHRVGKKKPNPWGLYDMHGNVAEWVLDSYVADFYERTARQGLRDGPFAVPKAAHPCVVRGGSWDDDPEDLRSAARGRSNKEWSQDDPLAPGFIVWHTNSSHVGFRVVRPLELPSDEECERLEGIQRDFEFRGDYERVRKWARPLSKLLKLRPSDDEP